MNKKLLVVGISALFSFSVIASNQQALTKEEINKLNKEILAKEGIEIPEYNEISIVPASKYINSKSITQNANDAHIAKKM